MLEYAELLLGPWVVPVGVAEACRDVADPATRRRLGVVRRRGGRSAPWSRWLGREVLEVYETEDESLLCSAHPPWLLTWVWEIYDADERRVAVVRAGEILDSYGRLLAVCQRRPEGRGERFVDVEGVPLGELMVAGDGRLLRFTPAVADQPFTKMALLGAVLAGTLPLGA